jgi:glucose-6-phosphate isomerase
MTSKFENDFQIPLNPEALAALPFGDKSIRRLSDLKTYFLNADKAEAMLQEDDPVVYETWQMEYDLEGSGLSIGTTKIYPGNVAGEFFFTRGHFHTDDIGDELYVPLTGIGVLALTTKDGESKVIELKPGDLVYVPGHLAHRTVNIGDEPLTFLSIWASHIDHDYDIVTKSGFPELFFQSDEGYRVVKNPKFAL